MFNEENHKCELLKEQDRFLPIANVSRMMKNSLPPPGKVAKETKECMQECVSEFISFVTSEAGEKCILEKRKTINGEDIIHSLATLGFENYVEPLQKFLVQYRQKKALSNQVQPKEDDSSDSSQNLPKPGELPKSLIPGHWD
ncbi:CAAT box DNA-binding protein subunit B [Intoshia linei]|uniref:CAAT box DNA-binding protein subunit B n=1 Tax=Intoshia linei TaxID=1819745 RepID=A0A177B6P8_9BILA|nr:CAAT box DNA-binding protein subunit B [Intoshia linei]